MLPYQGLQSVIGKLRFKDDTALRGLGLAKLTRTFDAYPVQDGSRRLYCLLPRGLAPSEAQKFKIETAIRQIIVLEQIPTGVSRVWPHGDVGGKPPKPSLEVSSQGDGQAEAPAGSSGTSSGREKILEFVDE